MKRLTMMAAAMAGVVLLAACGQGSGKQASGGRGVGDMSLPRDQAAHPAALPGAPRAGNGVTAPGEPAAIARKVLTPAALIRTADLVVEVAHGTDVAARANRAAQIATAAGGSVYADDRTAGSHPTAALTLKVPGPSLVSVLGQLSALGTEKARQSSTQDVTGEVADVDSRVRSAQASIDRLRLLFGRAVKVADVIALESELSQREADLESLQAQQRTFESRTAMATITLNLTTSAAEAAAHKDHNSGFLGGLDRGWRAFTSGATSLAAGIGTALPFLALALLIVGAAVVIRRRTRSGAPPVIAPPDPA